MQQVCRIHVLSGPVSLNLGALEARGQAWGIVGGGDASCRVLLGALARTTMFAKGAGTVHQRCAEQHGIVALEE